MIRAFRKSRELYERKNIPDLKIRFLQALAFKVRKTAYEKKERATHRCQP